MYFHLYLPLIKFFLNFLVYNIKEQSIVNALHSKSTGRARSIVY